jgi:topoisomerase-4 subunit A
VGELCDALIHVIKRPNATAEKLVELVPGPDFPTGGLLVESRDSVIEAYRTGRGGFRLRAKWTTEKQSRGSYLIVVTEIPFQVQKSRLVERIAELINGRKLPMLGDVRDESAEDVRLVLEPKSRTVDSEILMEALFRATDLEVRVPLNLNVLDRGRVPMVMDLRGALQAFLDHRLEVLVRRTRYKLAKAEDRLEVLSGYLVVYLNVDEVIRIIREEDEPKPVLIKTFKLNDRQAEAILDLRLRRLRKLDEATIRIEFDDLTATKKDLAKLLQDDSGQWKVITGEIKDIKKQFGGGALGNRRTEIGTPPAPVDVPTEAMVEREPITVICSEKGWIRAAKGHIDDNGEVKYKEGDGGRFWLHAQTTDRILLFATNGRFYTLSAAKLPGGRGAGDPVRLVVDLPNDEEIVMVMVFRPGQKLLVASSDGRGFIVAEDDTLAQTRNGRQVLNLGAGAEAALCRPADGDTVAVIGENRKLVLFPAAELPTMARGRGVVLQRYRDGGLADAKIFDLTEGLTWASGDRTRTERDLDDWVGKRAQAGRLAPKGFAKSGRFG